MTALYLRETHKDANITIFDINKDLSATINGGNGILYYSINVPFNNLSNSFNVNLCNIATNFDFYLIHALNYFFNNKKNRNLIKEISEKTDNQCSDSDYYSKDYWNKIIDKLVENNIKIINMTEIIDYKYENNKIKIMSKDNQYECDKLILCTAGNLNLIKNKCYHKFIQVFSGYSAIVEVKNVPKCFYYKDYIFITPYSETEIKITLQQLDIGFKNKNYMDNNSCIINIIKNNPEIKRLGLISIKNIWRGSRAMSYDIMPFIEQVDTNVYWLSGGGYMGTHMANNFGKWMVEYIDKKPFTGLPKNYEPTLKRLQNIRKKYLLIIITLVIIIMFGLYSYLYSDLWFYKKLIIIENKN